MGYESLHIEVKYRWTPPWKIHAFLFVGTGRRWRGLLNAERRKAGYTETSRWIDTGSD
jgi:hypothetical protein